LGASWVAVAAWVRPGIGVQVTGSQDPPQEYLVFRLAEVSYAISAASVIEIFRAVRIVPFPKAPPVVEGVINVRGQLIPVLDVRSRFGHKPKPIDAADHLIVAQASRRMVALRVDGAMGVETFDPAGIERPETFASGIGQVAGVVRLPEGVLFIHDLEKFLTEAEIQSLAEAERSGVAA